MFATGAIVICGIQKNCKGDIASGNVILEDQFRIPCCEKCAVEFDTDDENV